LRWTIKNVGARDWNTSFYYTYISGVEGSDASFYYLPGNVAINDSVELVVDMVAPTDPGNYRTTWSLINDDAVTLMTMTFIFTVQ
ncbi:MAG: NBR1-Ig-like domain-containing protein, partial [Anaerolineaceae bacterium]|nr:NBR1-Ig-like domain-containing protein [Anaerolineaceae bacterium]